MGVVVPSPPGGIPINQYIILSGTLQSAQTGNANGTDFDVTGMCTTQLLINPTAWTGTVTFWSSLDGITFVKIQGKQQDTGVVADNVANPGSTVSIWTFQTAGLRKIRAVTSNAGGTSVTVTGAASPYPNSTPFATLVLAAGSALIGSVRMQDGVSNNLATVSQFHNMDNQSPGGAAYGLLTGGVAQLLNLSGNLDRQREAGQDGIAPIGITTGGAQFKMKFKTTDSTDNFTAGTRTFTPVAMSGSIQGVAWSIQVGSVLILDSGASQETVLVTAVTATTFTCVTTKTHNGTGTPFNIVGAVYNEERDVAGELDGATGQGGAVAIAETYNGGGPLNNASAISNLQFDRVRNLQALGLGSGTISNNPLAAGSTTLTLNSAPTTLQPGMQIILDRVGANPETNYVDLNYTVGSTTVPLQNATANSHNQNTTVEWTQHAVLGPGLNGFLPTGLDVAEEVVYDPSSKKWYLEIAATADANSGQNLVMEALGLFNGTTFDRQRGNLDNISLIASAAYTTTQTVADQTNYNARGIIVVLDMTVVGTGSVTLEIDMKDPVSGKYVSLLTGAAVTTNSTNVYTVYPGAPATANVSANSPLPRTWRVKVTANNANSATYSVGAMLIV